MTDPELSAAMAEEIRDERRRLEVERLPQGDVVRVVLEQHQAIRHLLDDVQATAGAHRARAFADLRALLAVHEAAEEMVLRPVTATAVSQAVAGARNREEAEASEVLADLERLDTDSVEFERLLGRLREMVLTHALAEEEQELPGILEACGPAQRKVMGVALRAAAAVAPTHPHPWVAGSVVAQYAVGPVASLVDRARDAIRAVRP